MHHLLFIKLLTEKTETGFRQIYDAYASRLFAFILSVTEDKAKAEEMITKTFSCLWDEPPVLNLHHPDPFLFLLQKSMQHLTAPDGSVPGLRQKITQQVKNLRCEPQLKVISPSSSQQALSSDIVTRPSA